MNIPSFVLGATVIAFGTSLPELAVGVSAIFKDTHAIISGTVIGSNISNIFLITGVALLISPDFTINFRKNAAPLTILLLTTFMASFFLWDNHYSMTEGVVSVSILVAYIAYIVMYPQEEEEEEEHNENISIKTFLIFAASGLGVYFGAEYVIVAVQKIALLVGIKEDIISLTVVALGTSLPELAVTISAAKKKKFGIVLGNVIGSNVFNLLCVLGIPVVIGNFFGHIYQINDAVFTGFSIPLMILATILLFLLSLLKKTPAFFGIIFAIFYLIFILGTFYSFNMNHFF